MVKRYLPYVLLYVLGVASAWGLFQFTHSSSDGTQVASAAAEPARSTIRSAKSRRLVAAAPRVAKKKPVVEPKPVVKKRRVTEKKRVAKRKPARKPVASGAKLLTAVAKGDQRTVKRMLATKKHDINAVDRRGRSLLMTAVRKGHSDVARHLIKAGADVDAKARGGDTPLMAASRGGDPVIVHMLLEGGADIYARNRKGQTAQAMAKKGGHDVVYEFIADEVQRRGKHRGMVAKAQGLLSKLGYRLGAADGVPGPKTARAVRRFQKSHKLRVDGKVTPALISALRRKVARRQTGSSLASGQDSGAKSTARLVSTRSRDADENTRAANDGSVLAGAKSWLGRTTSSVSSFLKSNQAATAGHAQACQAAQDRWIQNANGDWIECTNVPNY
jgi:ankyrin repeat protein